MKAELDPGLSSLLFELCEAWQRQSPKLRIPFHGKWLHETMVVSHYMLKEKLSVNSFDFQTLLDSGLIHSSGKSASIFGIIETFVLTAKAVSLHRRDPELDRTQLVAEEEFILERLNSAWEQSNETFRIEIPAGNHVFTVVNKGLEGGSMSIAWRYFGMLKRQGYLIDSWSNGVPRLGVVSITTAGRNWYRNLIRVRRISLSEGKSMDGKAPLKVFISHSSADKERFVVPFAERLRAVGIDAWLDKWEMLPGDSLISKIFEEGLTDADSMIIILSKNSVDSRWVQQELNVAAVQRIQREMRIIPIILDIEDSDIPVVLKSTVWERITDLGSYDSEFNRVVASIQGESIKPPLGVPQKYFQRPTAKIGGFSQIDVQVLQILGDAAMDSELGYLETEQVLEDIREIGILEEELLESLEVLETEGYIKNLGADRQIKLFQLEYIALWKYASNFMEDFEEKRRAIAGVIVNGVATDEQSISEQLSLAQPFVAFVLESFKRQRMVELDAAIGKPLAILTISPKLKRFARETIN